MSDKTDTHALGAALTETLLAATYPIVNDQPARVVVQAMAGAMLATCRLASKSEAGEIIMLRRFADRLNVIADLMDDAHFPKMPPGMDVTTLAFVGDHLAARAGQERVLLLRATEDGRAADATMHQERAQAFSDVALVVRQWAVDCQT